MKEQTMGDEPDADLSTLPTAAPLAPEPEHLELDPLPDPSNPPLEPPDTRASAGLAVAEAYGVELP